MLVGLRWPAIVVSWLRFLTLFLPFLRVKLGKGYWCEVILLLCLAIFPGLSFDTMFPCFCCLFMCLYYLTTKAMIVPISEGCSFSCEADLLPLLINCSFFTVTTALFLLSCLVIREYWPDRLISASVQTDPYWLSVFLPRIVPSLSLASS